MDGVFMLHVCTGAVDDDAAWQTFDFPAGTTPPIPDAGDTVLLMLDASEEAGEQAYEVVSRVYHYERQASYLFRVQAAASVTLYLRPRPAEDVAIPADWLTAPLRAS